MSTTALNNLGFAETERRQDYIDTRALLMLCPDVHEVIALSWIPENKHWLWCIKTTYASWPKYVNGTFDPETDQFTEQFQCGRLENALEDFNASNFGEHQ